MSSYGKIPAAKNPDNVIKSSPPGPEVSALLKKRMEILRKMAELKKEYDQINNQLPFDMRHSSACDQLEDNLQHMEARTPVYLKHGVRI